MIVADDTSTRTTAIERGTDIRTFLFADFRGWTRFTREHGDAAASALAIRFADLVRAVVPEFEGELLELRGDEVLCVFRSARQALRAAVELQRRFRTATDGEPALPLGVGMGLDAGEAIPTEGGYRGTSVNLAARLCAIAKPGQVLASESAAHLAQHVDGLRLAPRRAVRLKGMQKPVRLVEVVPEEPLPPVPDLPRRADSERRLRGRRVIAAIGTVLVVVSGAVAGLVAGRGGSASVLTVHRDALVFLSENGHARAVGPVGAAPSGVAVGGGWVWVTNRDDGTVTGLRLAGGERGPFPVGTAPTGIAYFRGALWVAASGSGVVDRVNPATGRVMKKIPTGNGPQGVAVTANRVWVSNSLDATVAEINPNTNKVVDEIPAGPDPTAIVAAAGDIWVANTTSDTVSRIQASTGQPLQPRTVQYGPDALAVHGDSVWVANGDSGSVSRISAHDAQVRETLPAGLAPRSIAVTGGTVWAGDARGSLVGLDPFAPTQRTRAALVGVPLALAGTGDGVWATVARPLTGHKGGTLRAVEEFSFLDPLDPAIAYNLPDYQALPFVYDGLTGFRRVSGPQGATVVADLATTLPQPSNRGRTYTFEVRRGVRYSTGQPVKPADFRWALERAFDAGVAPLYGDIVGASACKHRPSPGGCDLGSGIKTDDAAGTVTFHLTRRDPDFLAKLAQPFAAAVPPSVPAPPDCGRKTTCGYKRQPPPVPGTGPYMIEPTKLRFNTRHGELVLVRNPHFHEWSADAQPSGYPNRIVFHFGSTPTNQAAQIQQGSADWSFDETPPRALARLVTSAPDLVHRTPVLGITALALNNRLPPFTSTRARQAVNYALDRSAVARGLAGDDKITCQILPPGMLGYVPYCRYTQRAPGTRRGSWLLQDRDRARQLVKTSGTKGMHVTVWLNATGFLKPAYTRSGSIKLGQMIVSTLQTIGYDAHLQLLRANANAPATAQVALAYWFSDYPSPSAFLQVLFSCASRTQASSTTHFCSPSLDHRMSQALQSQADDPTGAATRWAQIDQDVANQAPWVPLTTPIFTDIVSKRVGNYQHNPQLGTLLDQLWVQ